MPTATVTVLNTKNTQKDKSSCNTVYSVLDLSLWLYLAKYPERQCSARLDYKAFERNMIVIDPKLNN